MIGGNRDRIRGIRGSGGGGGGGFVDQTYDPIRVPPLGQVARRAMSEGILPVVARLEAEAKQVLPGPVWKTYDAIAGTPDRFRQAAEAVRRAGRR